MVLAARVGAWRNCQFERAGSSSRGRDTYCSTAVLCHVLGFWFKLSGSAFNVWKFMSVVFVLNFLFVPAGVCMLSGFVDQLGDLLLIVPVYILFAGIMVPVGSLVGRAAKSGIVQQRSQVVGTQTLIELFIMVVLVIVMPRTIRTRSTTS